MNLFLGIVPRPSRPSPNAAPVEVITSNEPQATLSDVHYDRLEAILIEKIQTYVQSGRIQLHFIDKRMIENLFLNHFLYKLHIL